MHTGFSGRNEKEISTAGKREACFLVEASSPSQTSTTPRTMAPAAPNSNSSWEALSYALLLLEFNKHRDFPPQREGHTLRLHGCALTSFDIRTSELPH